MANMNKHFIGRASAVEPVAVRVAVLHAVQAEMGAVVAAVEAVAVEAGVAVAAEAGVLKEMIVKRF